MGNQEAYNEIDQQRRTERNYKFAWDDSLLERTEKATREKFVRLRGKEGGIDGAATAGQADADASHGIGKADKEKEVAADVTADGR